MSEFPLPIPENLKCRVTLMQEEKDDAASDVFCIEICGTIRAPDGCSCAVVNISIADTTDGLDKAKRVRSRVEKWQIKNSNVFCYTAKLGRLPEQVTTLADWMNVAKIPADCLTFPLKGIRNLQFITTILSGQNAPELACAACPFTYESTSPGYIELEESTRQAKTMAVTLAFIVAAADKKISAREVEVIQNWAKTNTAATSVSLGIRGLFNRLWVQTIALFHHYNRFYCYKICRKIADAAPLKVRCNILELCLRVIAANGTIAAAQLDMLKNMADWFGIHRERFRAMAENILMAGMYQIEDLEISVGINSDMSTNQICRQLSKEYRKWNARVTNRNPEIEIQAEQMLKLISEMRNQYTV